MYFARFDGKQVYFGKGYAHAAQCFAEAFVRYEGGEPIGKPTAQDSIIVVEATAQYLSGGERYCGRGSSETGKIRDALKCVCELHGREPVEDLYPQKGDFC